MKVKKIELKGLIEPFIYKDLKSDTYEVKQIEASDLLVWNRFDLAFKLFYLDYREKNKELAEKIYTEDIRSQTVGKFEERGKETKNSMKKYIDSFTETYKNIDKFGFDASKTMIPLSSNGSIINGAHRVASAIHLKKKVSCVQLELSMMKCDYQYFFERKVSTEILDMVATHFIKYSKNTYMAFLWPSGIGNKKEAESKFSNIVYKKEIYLSPNGAFNLLYELYKHMDWIGSSKDGYSGIQKKLVECFPNFNSFTIIVFQEKSLEKVRDIKEEVRKIYNIGYSSIHITDTKKEVIEASKLILNENALHFLNYRKLNNIDKKTRDEILIFKGFLDLNSIKTDDIILDASIILSLYGLRKNSDIDYLLEDNIQVKSKIKNINEHDEVLRFYQKDKKELIYNPKNYFYFENLKFISFEELYIMKKNRNEIKDQTDCNIMQGLIEDNYWKKKSNQIKQSIFYLKIKIKNAIKETIIKVLKYFRVYEIVRNFYLNNIEKNEYSKVD